MPGTLLPPSLPAAHPLPVCRLAVMSPAGEVGFDVEVASTAQSRHRGLMGRTSLPGGHGMLFVFDRAERLAMWMKNTLVPLDMLFFAESGELVHIERNAEPHSLRHRQAPSPVRYVLEVNGGEARTLAVAEGVQLNSESLAACVRAAAP